MAHSKLVYNAYGEKYEVPRERVSSLDELRSGDHIAFHRHSGAYWHHAIVEYIDEKEGKFGVIEYTNTVKEIVQDGAQAAASLLKNHGSQSESGEGKDYIPAMAKVKRTECKLENEDVYVFKHKKCLDPKQVVENAQGRLGKGGYNPFINNCEHFAMWCKTGKSSSDQINKSQEMAFKEVVAKTIPEVPLVAKMVIKNVTELLKLVYDIFTATSKPIEETLKLRFLKWLQNVSPDLQLRKLLQGVLGRLCEVLTEAAKKVEFVKDRARWVIEKVVVQIVSEVKQKLAFTPHEAKVLKQAVTEYFEKVLSPVLPEWLGKVFLPNSKLCKHLKDVLIWFNPFLTTLKRTDFIPKERAVTKAILEVDRRVLAQTADGTMKAAIREKVVTQAASKSTAGMLKPLVAGAVCTTVIEGGLVVCDIYRQHSDMKEGKIDEKDFKTAVKKRVTTGVGSAAGTTLGAAIGQVVIPVPVLGGLVGGFVGGLSGKLFANMVATQVFE